MYKLISKIRLFTKSYIKAILWCFIVLFILFLPIICSSFLELLIDKQTHEQETFQFLIQKFIDIYINNGSFLLIIIGISSSAYIDYLFEIKMSNTILVVHIWYFIVIAISLMLYTVIFTLNPTSQNTVFFIDKNLLKYSCKILFALSFIYSIVVKSLLFEKKNEK